MRAWRKRARTRNKCHILGKMNEEIGLTKRVYPNPMLALVFQSKTVLKRHKFVRALDRVESVGKLLVG